MLPHGSGRRQSGLAILGSRECLEAPVGAKPDPTAGHGPHAAGRAPRYTIFSRLREIERLLGV